MRMRSRRRKAYSGVRSSCPNGILLTLVTSGAKYRLDSNIRRAASDSQDTMCCSTDRQMDVVPAQMLLVGQGALLGSFARRCYSHGNPAAGFPGLWVRSRGETWGWSGHRSFASPCWHGSPPSVVLCWFVPSAGLISGVCSQSCKE